MTGWGPGDLQVLREALGEFDHARVRLLCHQFVDHLRSRREPLPAQAGLAVLKMLQRKRHITLVQDVAEALLAHGTDSVGVRHRYALALVDHDRTTAAEALLTQLPYEVRRTNTEVQGAIGRVHKQRYLTSGPVAGRERKKDLA